MTHWPKQRIVVDSDWMTAGGIAILGLVSLLSAFGDLRQLLTMRVKVGGGESIFAFLAVVYGVISWTSRERFWRTAFALLAAAAAIRVVCHYLHASESIQGLAAINSLIFGVIAWILVLIPVIQWFRTSSHVERER